MKKPGIHIKPSKEGSLRKALGTPKGSKIAVATLEKEKRSKSPAMRKKANFALNARSWKHTGKKRVGRYT